MMAPLLLTSQAAREQLGVSERGLRDLLKKGLPFIKVGKRRMFPANDIATWLSEQAQCHAPRNANRTTSTGVQARRSGGFRTPPTVVDFATALERTPKT